MTKPTTDFSKTTKPTTPWVTPSKGSSDFTKQTKIATNFDLNFTFESNTSYYDEVEDYDSATDSYDGEGAGYSPLGEKATTDFDPSSKTPTDWSE